jgi:hypothetical protein
MSNNISIMSIISEKASLSFKNYVVRLWPSFYYLLNFLSRTSRSHYHLTTAFATLHGHRKLIIGNAWPTRLHSEYRQVTDSLLSVQPSDGLRSNLMLPAICVRKPGSEIRAKWFKEGHGKIFINICGK